MKVIAEIGSNFKSLEDCFFSIEQAKAAGADAVKFQCFTSEEMYGLPGKIDPLLNLDRIPLLKNAADKNGIEFMCTMFSPEFLRFSLPYLETIKIASSDMEYLELIDVAMASGKDIYLSTGGHTKAEIAQLWITLTA